jgi:hypothetical protein
MLSKTVLRHRSNGNVLSSLKRQMTLLKKRQPSEVVIRQVSRPFSSKRRDLRKKVLPTQESDSSKEVFIHVPGNGESIPQYSQPFIKISAFDNPGQELNMSQLMPSELAHIDH